MRISDIDHRNKEDILKQIEALAGQYTPEWRFDRQNPDAGTALAGVYADMFASALGKMNRVLDKNRIAFFNSVNAGVLPPVPAGGYVVFRMVNDTVEGAEIPSGMGVYADTEDGEVAFRTVDDLYATPSAVEEIYQVWDQQDVIRHIFSGKDKKKEFTLFDDTGENLQRHAMYFSHDTLLKILGEAAIELGFYVRGDVPVERTYIEKLLNPEYAVFEYYSEEGFRELRPVMSKNGALYFHKSELAPSFQKTEIGGKESYWIRCRILQMEPFTQFAFESFYLTVKGSYIPPDVVGSNGIECNLVEYTPFGERFGLYNEVYFACEEALSKKGSRVDFSVTVDFVRIPISDEPEDGIAWDWVMKKSDFKVDPEYDVTIEEVLWEYYNGNGWSRLFPDNRYGDLFQVGRSPRSQNKSMHFICPEDMEPILVNSCESCYIRARIMKINNLYKNKGFYVAPVLSDTAFSYDYSGNYKQPEWIYTENNLEAALYNGRERQQIRPFINMGMRENAVYLGFGQPLKEGPVKILFTMLENRNGNHPQLRWEYYTDHGFVRANMVDETEGFSRTGIVTMMGNEDFEKAVFFGKELYWMRIVDETGFYEREGFSQTRPCVQDIHMNAVRVTNVDFVETEYFFTERYEENRQIQLLHPHVTRLELWVDESANLSERQLARLREEREVQCEYDASGILARAWVLWEERSDFIGTTGADRCFCLDRSEGILTFGNGRYGRIIPAEKKENIRICYTSGGGSRSNLPPESIHRMEYAVGFVSEVTNPHRILGGEDQETLEEAIRRHSKLLKHHNRAVTAEDFEQLALCASRNIRRAQCFTGYNEEGKLQQGAMTLVILQKEFEKYGFHEVRDQVLRYLQDKMRGGLLDSRQFYVAEPKFAEIGIRMELTADGFQVVFRMKKEIEERLAKFLNPLTGHFDGKGWKFGSLPTVVQIQNLLRDIRGVKYIRNIYLSAYMIGKSGRTEADMEKLKRHPFVLPVNGKHNIMLKVE